jgi:hypothetical protein
MKLRSTLLSILCSTLFISSFFYTMENDDFSLDPKESTPADSMGLQAYLPSTSKLTTLFQQGYTMAGPLVQTIAKRSLETAKEFGQTPTTTFFDKMQRKEFDTLIAAGDLRSVVSASEKAFRHKFKPSGKHSDLQQPRNQQRIAAIIQELAALKTRTRSEIFLNQTLAQEYIPLQEQALQEKLTELALQIHPEIVATFQIDLDECVSNFLENYAQLYREYQRATRSCLEESKTIATNLHYLYECAPKKSQANNHMISPAHYESLEAFENLLSSIQKRSQHVKSHTALHKIDLVKLLQELDAIEKNFEKTQNKTSLSLPFPEHFETAEQSETIDTFVAQSLETIMEKRHLANPHHQESLAKLLAKKMNDTETDQSSDMLRYQEKQKKLYRAALCKADVKIQEEKERWNQAHAQIQTILDSKMEKNRTKTRQIAANAIVFDQLTQRESTDVPSSIDSFSSQEKFEYALTRYVPRK